MKKGLYIAFFLLVVCARVGADNSREIALGDSCMERFNLIQALQHFEIAFKEHDDAAIRLRLAECHYRRQAYQQCINIVKPLSDDSLDHKTMRMIFYCYKSLAQPAKQKEWGHRIANRYPMDGEIVAELGLAYNLENASKKAQQVCIPYWVRDHDNMAVNRVLADAYFLDREFDMAKYSYEELLAAGDTTYKSLFHLGVCYEKQDSLRKASAMFQQAIALSGGMMAGALYHQGTVLNAMKEYEGAQRCFEQALPLLLPDSLAMFTCYRGIAESNYAKGKYAEAAAFFSQALPYLPTSVTTYYYLALSLDAIGRRDKAKENYREFLHWAAREEHPAKELKELMVDARRRLQ